MSKHIPACALGLALLASASLSLAQVPPIPPPPALPEVSITIAPEEPPPVKQEVVVETSRPAQEYVWVAGYWDYRPTGWVWMAGHWDRPPATQVSWVQPQYVQVESGVRYVPGHWSSQKVIEYDNGRKVKEKVKVKVK